MNLEHLVAGVATSRYRALEHEEDRRAFLSALRDATQQFFDALNPRPDTASSAPAHVNYNMPRMGEAYALWYHMLRVENIYMALARAYGDDLPSGRVRMLDLGSGTGAGAMALGHLVGQRSWAEGEGTVVSVSCVEGAAPMRGMANRILRHFRNTLGVSEQLFDWNHEIARIQEAAKLPSARKFDLILFSYTFWVMSGTMADAFRTLSVRIAHHLAPGGLVCFLTPWKPPQKRKFIDGICEQLGERGFQRLDVEPEEEDFPSGRRRPHPIMNARNFYNQECRRLGLPPIFKGVPYYSFDCQCDVFTR